jgi:hypothetical protein
MPKIGGYAVAVRPFHHFRIRGRFQRMTPVQKTKLTIPNVYRSFTPSDHPSSGMKKK